MSSSLDNQDLLLSTNSGRGRYTYLCLIPKVAQTETIQQFRPIGLYNTTYKLITKILVNHIRPHLAKLISPHQGSFLPGKKYYDNVIIVQKTLYTLRKIKGKVGGFWIKIDLEKAYDKLEWDFIGICLPSSNFPFLSFNIS